MASTSTRMAGSSDRIAAFWRVIREETKSEHGGSATRTQDTRPVEPRTHNGVQSRGA